MLFDKLKQLIAQDKADTELLDYFSKNQGLLKEHDEEGHSALYHILKSARSNVALLLFKQYPFSMDIIAVKGLDATLLHLAAQEGHIDVVEHLLLAGANKDMPTLGGATPLFIAAHSDHIEVVNLLLAAGADKDKPMADRRTPLLVAAQNAHIDVVRALLLAGADTDQARESDGISPLFVAAHEGHIKVVECLLLAGADKDKATTNGATPLFIAAQEGHKEVVDRLLAFGADITLNLKGTTPLFQASMWDKPDVVKVLASHPDTTLEMLQTYVSDSLVPDAIQQILTSEIESRLEMATQDVACRTALKFWPQGAISQTYISVPVRASDNQVYEEACILRWIERHDTSPMENLPLKSLELTTDLTAKGCIAYAREIIDAFCKHERIKEFESWCDAIKQAIVADYQAAELSPDGDVARPPLVGSFFPAVSAEQDDDEKIELTAPASPPSSGGSWV